MRFCSVLAIIAGLTGPAQSDVTFLGKYNIPPSTAGLGGLSALEIADDGLQFWMLNDAGVLFQGRFQRDRDYRIIGIEALPQGTLRVPSELSFGLKIDSEGLAVHKNGQMDVSFEGDHSVVANIQGNAARNLAPYPAAIAALPENKGLEALAVSKSGTLFALPEYQDHSSGYVPIYALTTAGWVTVMRLPTRRGFLVTGADFGSDGHLYVLERRSTLFGFRTRVRQVDLSQNSVRTILQTRAGTYGNLEGIALSPLPQGGQIMTLIADNNFLSLFPNEVIEYQIFE